MLVGTQIMRAQMVACYKLVFLVTSLCKTLGSEVSELVHFHQEFASSQTILTRWQMRLPVNGDNMESTSKLYTFSFHFEEKLLSNIFLEVTDY